MTNPPSAGFLTITLGILLFSPSEHAVNIIGKISAKPIINLIFSSPITD
ncbi:hypothetical protein AOR13_1138 [Alteromonas stellipolaris LMG 21856]|nr:hypothetical protein AOR13_1138 [Alteromonas stellipolaris LMG 21856]